MSVFKTKPYLTKEAGQFKFDFYYAEGNLRGTYLQISAPSGIFAMRIAGNTHAYGYLLAAAQQDRTDQLQGYAVTLFIPAMELTQDAELVNDIQEGIVKWQKRKEKEAAELAKKVTPEQDMADEALMREAIERGGMTRQQRRKAERESRKQMRKVLNEDKEDES